LPMYDPKQRRQGITLARENPGWEPNVKLEQGLEKTVAYL
jgi:UDP-glucuronate decarboxylase